jgi:hypothetical protein
MLVPLLLVGRRVCVRAEGTQIWLTARFHCPPSNPPPPTHTHTANPNPPTLAPTKAPTTAAIAPPPAPAPAPSPANPAPEPAPAPAPAPANEDINAQAQQTFAAYFAVTLHNIAPHAFDAPAAQRVIADAAGLAHSQVFILAGPSSSTITGGGDGGDGRKKRGLAARLLGRLLQAPPAPATDLAIRLTNLPDRATASGLLDSVSPFLIAPSPDGFATRYATAAEQAGASPTVVLQSASATTYAFPPLAEGACLLDAAAGLILSWDTRGVAARGSDGFVEVQLEGNGEGWIGGGLTRADSTAMVATPSHKVLIADYAMGGEPSLVSMEGYEAFTLFPVNASDFGVSPTLVQAAGGKLVLRYRQDVRQAAPGRIDLSGQTNFIFAYSPFGYPSMHTVSATTRVHWPSGTCNPAWVLPDIEGYWLLPLIPLLALLVLHLCLRPCYPGPLGLGKTLLQRRLAPIPIYIPPWLDALTLGSIPTWCNMKVGELVTVLLYLAAQIALLLYWSLQAGPATPRSAGIAFGKAALTNTMLAFLPVSKTTLWVRLCGLSFERAVRFHRWLSQLAVATMTVHLICLASPASRVL